MKWRYMEENRIGDHICYYSDLRKMRAHYPEWANHEAAGRTFSEEIAAKLDGTCWRTNGNRMRILITGVCGFVGSAMARALLERREGLTV
jgi:ribosomal protein S6E (S10)